MAISFDPEGGEMHSPELHLLQYTLNQSRERELRLQHLATSRAYEQRRPSAARRAVAAIGAYAEHRAALRRARTAAPAPGC